MPYKTIPRLDGGVNEVANPDTLPDDVLQQCVNFELLGDGVLTRRTEPREFGASVSGDSLNTVLTDAVTGVLITAVYQISPPYYPVKKLSDMTGEYILMVYGQSQAGDYELYIVYENDSNTWTATKVNITGITYTEDTYLEFFVGDDKVIITDTYKETLNFPHYVKIDPEGTLISGLFSIQAPSNKATLIETTEYDESEFEEDPDNVNLGNCGLVQVTYTVVTKDGDESNPAPVSDSKMMQFFKKDKTDGTHIRFIDSVQISNLSCPALTGDLTEELKYFNLYFRIIPYSEGEVANPFYFSQRVEIIDKDNNSGETGNGYILTVPVDTSIQISYENDIAPYAKHAAETSAITGFGNIREKLSFPYEFEKYGEIKINNTNNKNFAAAVVKIRIYDENSGQTDYIDGLDLSYYKKNFYNEMKNLDHIRIYDADLLTPLEVAYDKYIAGTYADIYVKIPLITAGQLKVIYLAWNTSTSSNEGVNNEDHRTFEYGQWTKMDAAIAAEMFPTERVKSNRTIICSPFDFQDASTEIINNADANNPGKIVGSHGSFDDGGTKIFGSGLPIGGGRYYLSDKTRRIGEDFSEIRYEQLPFGTIPNSISFWCRLQLENFYNSTGSFNDNIIRLPIFSFYQAQGGSEDYKGIFLGLKVFDDVDPEEYGFALYGAEDMTGLDGASLSRYSQLAFDEARLKSGTANDIFLLVSISKSNSASIFIGDLATNSMIAQKVLWGEWVTPENFDKNEGLEWYYKDIDTFAIGFNDIYAGKITESGDEFRFYVSQFQLIKNKYFNAENNDDVSAVYNIARFMPSYEATLGEKVTLEEITS